MKFFRLTIITASFFLSFSTAFAQDTSLYISKGAELVTPGERFTIDIKVRSTDQSINAVSGTLTYPSGLLRLVSTSRDQSIINFWTKNPSTYSGRINFEGIVLNPGYQGTGGSIFRATFEAKNTGTAVFRFTDGSVLANDGRGTNLLTNLQTSSIKIGEARTLVLSPEPSSPTTPVLDSSFAGKLPALPVITEYPNTIGTGEKLVLKGRGEPGALTKLVFETSNEKSIGERFIQLIQTKKQRPSDVYVQNDEQGNFEYSIYGELLAGAYSATPFLVDRKTDTEKPGLGAKLLVSDSPMVRFLVVLINVLALLVPIVALIMVIYFIPWYSLRRMHLLKKQIGLEEEKLEISGHQINREDRVIDEAIKNLSQNNPVK